MPYRSTVVLAALLGALGGGTLEAQVPPPHAVDGVSPLAATSARWRTSPLLPHPAPPLTPSHIRSCRLPSRTSTVLLQAGGGLGGGFLGTMAAAVTVLVLGSGRYVSSVTGRSTDLDALIDILAYPSYVVGSAVGVHWVGRARDHRGRFLPTLLGSALGLGAPGAVLGYHLSHSREMAKDAACAAPAEPATGPGLEVAPEEP